MSCDPCCCSDCIDKPSQLVVTVTYPAGGGEVIAADPDTVYEDSTIPGAWGQVTTNCRPPPHAVGLMSVITTDAGSGYTEAPAISLSGGGPGVGAVWSIDLTRELTTTYVSAVPTVAISPSETGVAATAELNVRQVYSDDEGYFINENPTITSGGSGYTSAPVATISLPDGTKIETPCRVALPAIVTAIVQSPVRKITIDDGGSGYTKAPAITFPAPSGGQVRAAAAEAIVAGPVASISLTTSAAYYREIPTVTIGGGGSGAEVEATIGNGYVQSITVTDPGEGYTSAPAVSVSGNATATSRIFLGRVFAVFVTSAGSGYESTPEVTFSGGGGSGAKATANVIYQVTGLTLTKQGEGYPPNPPVTFSGDGFGGSASATINGSVVGVSLTRAGSYRNVTRSDDPDYRIEWPTIKFSTGDAKASLEFWGGVTCSVVSPGGGYTEKPTITLSGGGGSGAAAEAQLEYEPTHTFVKDISDCSASVAYNNCTGTESDFYPPAPCVGCGGSRFINLDIAPETTQRYGEEFYWGVTSRTAAVGDIVPLPSRPLGELDWRDVPYLFPGEAMYVYWVTRWDVPGVRELPGAGYLPMQKETERISLKRLFERVPPSGKVRAVDIGGFPIPRPSEQPIGALSGFVAYEDLKGDIVWRPSAITLESGGANLLIPKGTTTASWRTHSGNLTSIVSVVDLVAEFTAEYDPPQVGDSSVLGVLWASEPQFSYSISPLADAGDYTVSAVSVTEAGETLLSPDGSYLLAVSLAAGHTPTAYFLPNLRANVSGGRVVSVSILSGGLLRGAGRLTSVTLPEDDFTDPGRSFVGRSTFRTTVARSEPVVSTEAGGTATLEVVLAEGADQNGGEYWSVSQVNVTAGGSGYEQGQAIAFTTDGVTAAPATATVNLPPRGEPSLVASADGGAGAVLAVSYAYDESSDTYAVSSVTVSEGGAGYTNGALVSFAVSQGDTEQSAAYAQINTAREMPEVTATLSTGAGAVLQAQLTDTGYGGWYVSSISVVSAGAGYSDGEQVSFGGDGDYQAFGTISVGSSGEVLSVTVWDGGFYYTDTGVIQSVDVFGGGAYYSQSTSIASVTVNDGGRYYGLEIQETSEPLAPPECVGAVTEDNGWVTKEYRSYTQPHPLEAGESIPVSLPLEVGESTPTEVQTECWISGQPSLFIEPTRTRRCPDHTLTFEFQ